MRRGAFCLTLLLGLALSLAARADGIGVVLMHGLKGSPDRLINTLGAAIEAAGFPVERPTMCWSRSAVYAAPFLDCLNEIDAALARLRGRGATQFVVAGQSLGGSAALAYGARHPGLKGIVALAPAPPPGIARRPAIAQSLAKADDLIAQGQGDVRADFTSTNNGRDFAVFTTPRIYVSFLAADGPANIPANTAQIKVPLLWVAGTSDTTQRGGPDYAFNGAAPNPASRYVTVDADHLGTPDAAIAAVTSWLKTLPRN